MESEPKKLIEPVIAQRGVAVSRHSNASPPGNRWALLGLGGDQVQFFFLAPTVFLPFVLALGSGCGSANGEPSAPHRDLRDVGKEEVVPSLSNEFHAPSSIATVEGEEASVLALREPPRPMDAGAIGEALLSKLHSGIAGRVVEAFTEDLVIVGGATRIFAAGPAPRRMLEAMVGYPAELSELSALRFRDIRAMSRRSLADSSSPFFLNALKSLPPQAPSELVLVVSVESPSRVLFPARGRTLLLLREDAGIFRIRAIVDDATGSAP